MVGNEAFSRVRIDAQLKDAGWELSDGRSVRFEQRLSDGTKADYVLCDRRGQALAELEAKKASLSLGAAEPQALAYAAGLHVPFVFLANGEEVRFRDLDRDAHFRPVATVFAQEDLERRIATRTLRMPPTGIAVDGRVAGRDYQRDRIEVLPNVRFTKSGVRCRRSHPWSERMLKDVVAVEALEPYRLRLVFEDGVAGEVDVARLVRFDGVFAPLSDPTSFRAVRVEPEAGTVVWPSGADLDPNVLYAEVTGVPVADRRSRPQAS